MTVTMDIAPLALVVLLGYGLLLAVALTTWTAVSYSRQEPDAEAEADAGPTKAAPERTRKSRQVSNDEVRGARSRRARGSGDPFQGEAKLPTPASTGTSAMRVTERVTWEPAPATKSTASDASGSRSNSAASTEEQALDAPSRKPSSSTSSSRSTTPPPTRKQERSPAPKRIEQKDESDDEDAFERFLKPRSDDFDLR